MYFSRASTLSKMLEIPWENRILRKRENAFKISYKRYGISMICMPISRKAGKNTKEPISETMDSRRASALSQMLEIP